MTRFVTNVRQVLALASCLLAFAAAAPLTGCGGTADAAERAEAKNSPPKSFMTDPDPAQDLVVLPGPPPRIVGIGAPAESGMQMQSVAPYYGYFTGINNLDQAVGVTGQSVYQVGQYPGCSPMYDVWSWCLTPPTTRSFFWDDARGAEEYVFDQYEAANKDLSAMDINDSGEVVGFYAPVANFSQFQGFRWDRARGLQLFGTLPNTTAYRASSFALGVNADGMIVGKSDVVGADYQGNATLVGPHGVVFHGPGAIEDLGALPPGSWPCKGLRYDGYDYREVTYIVYAGAQLQQVNSLGHAVGFSQVPGATDCLWGGEVLHAWAPGTFGDLNPVGAKASFALGINDSDQIVGAYLDNGGNYNAVVWEAGAPRRLPNLVPGPASWSVAHRINNNGYIIGISWTLEGVHGVVWKPDNTIIDLGRGVPHAINDRNKVVGGMLMKYSWYDLSLPAIWDLGYEKPVVEISIDPQDVEPVLSGHFDAVTQDWVGTRYDLVDVVVRAHMEGNSAPLQNATLVLTATAADGSGGHSLDSHGGTRPTGTFWPPGMDPDSTPGSRGSMTVPVTAFETTYRYLTSGVSGVERITATLLVNGTSTSASAEVTIRYPGLAAMPRIGSTYHFTDQNGTGSQRHGNINNFLQPDFASSVDNAFQRYFDKTNPNDRFLFNATAFSVTEASLPWGGLLDVGATAPWRPPHMTHRTGREMDVRWWDVYDDEAFFDACDYAGIDCAVHCNNGNGDLTGCPGQSPIWQTQRHYHLAP